MERKGKIMNSPLEPRDPMIVGAEFGGKWIAWNDNADQIIASGNTMEEARQGALSAGVTLPGLEFVPPADRAFVGGL